MRKRITSLLAMLFVLLFGLNASASTTWNFTIDIDNPAAVTLSQDYYGNNPIALQAGVNNLSLVDDSGYGASFYLICSGDYVFTKVTANSSEEDLWDNKRYSGYVSQQNSAFVVRTANLNDLRSASVTVNIDNAAGATVTRNGDSAPLSLTNGSNTVKFNPDTETPFTINHFLGSHKSLGSVKYNGTEVPYEQYSGYSVTPSNGGVIDIVTYNPNATRYTLSFASDCNLNAISKIEVQGIPVTGWESGSISFEEGTSGFIYFDNDNYDISDIVMGGYSQSYYGSGMYFYMSENMEVSFTATSKGGDNPPTPANSVSFRLEGWTGNSDGNNLCINKGTSKWDTPLSFDSSYFTDSFTEESQSYFIYTEGNYRIRTIKKMHGDNTSNVAVYDGGTPVTLSDGDAVEITVYKYVDLYTATLNISADLKNYDGDVFISNESGHVNKQQIYQGTNVIKFNANDSSDCNFTLSSGSTDLYSVKLNGNTVSGSNGIYNLGYLTDGAQVEIIAADPTYSKPASTLIFDNDNNKAAIARMLVNGEDLPPSVWMDNDSYDAHIGDYFIVYFNKGYTITDFVFGDNTYNYDPNITTPQPLDFNGEIYFFGHAIDEEEYMPVSFKATAVSGPSYSYNVTFNVNFEGGVKVTDVSDSQNPVVVPISGTSYTHTFTAEYNYVNIEPAEGYDLESVTINPNNDNPSYSKSPDDNGVVNYIMVEDNYIITIKVKKAASEEPSNPYGTATVNVIGSPSQFTFMNGSTNVPIAMTSGINSLELYAESSTYLIMPVNNGIESVTLNGTEVSPLTMPFTYYNLTGVTRDAQIVITTVGGSSTEPEVPASFTMNISGSLESISYLMDENRKSYDLVLGENVIALPNNTDTFAFLLSAEKALYSVKVNDETVNGTNGGLNYWLNLKGGDVVYVDTEFPNVDVDINWSFNGCDSSIVTGIRIDGGNKYTTEDEEFAAYLNGFSLPMGANVEYWLDTTNFTLTSVMHNDKSELTSDYHVFAPSGDTYITITAAQKRIYNYTLSTNDPEHLVVYPGTSTVSQPIELTGNSTQLEVNEVTGNTCITIVPKYGYYFDEDNCTLDGTRMLKNTEGYYTVYPEENSVVRITITEVNRPEAAVLYIDSFDNIEYVALTQDRYQAFSTDKDGLVAGYHVFHFNTTDLGTDGLTLNFRMKEEGAVPVIYVNNVAQNFNAESCQLSNLMLEDGDVIKIFGTKPIQHTITFVPNEGSNEFVITIDRINEFNDGTRIAAPARFEQDSNGSVSALTGTEISFTPSANVNLPWVQVDDKFVNIEPGQTHTVVVSGNHSISYGKDSTMTGIDGVIQTIVGNGNADIYNLQGVCIKRNATGSDLKSLKPGIYVIGGQKVFVK